MYDIRNLTNTIYCIGSSKADKAAIRRSANNFQVVDDLLSYKQVSKADESVSIQQQIWVVLTADFLRLPMRSMLHVEIIFPNYVFTKVECGNTS